MINTQALSKILNDLRTTESRSLVHHLRDTAQPHLTVTTYPIWRSLNELMHVSDEHVRRLEILLRALDLPIDKVTFDIDVARFHFITLEYMLPALIAQKRNEMAGYETALTHAGNDEAVKFELQDLMEANRHHLVQLQSFLDELPKDDPASYRP